MLAAMPMAMSLGIGVAQPIPFAVAAIQNINGQAITLANMHRDKRNPADWHGFRFAVPRSMIKDTPSTSTRRVDASRRP